MVCKAHGTFRWSWLTLFIALCLPLRTMAQTVSYNYAEGVNFAVLKTFNWISIEGAGAGDASLDRSIREAIEEQLAQRGLRKSADRPQLLILYQVSVGREKEITMYDTGGLAWGYGPGWIRDQSYGYNHGYAFFGVPSISTATDSTIPIGNLVFDMYDAMYEDLIWRAEVDRALIFVGDADKRWKRLNKAIINLFGPYPPKLRR